MQHRSSIAESAKELNRSMNADIVARLEQSFEQKIGDLESVPLEKLLSVVMKKLGENSISLTREEIQRGKQLSKKNDEN
ncbi:Arc family DNA-binding protein [Acinetobacter sp. TY2]|uniref:Arc family DNA-binding protein n=1 Tax=Acinetobacter sp. TY2 TaxID=3387403 RepID=UPI0039176B0D